MTRSLGLLASVTTLVWLAGTAACAREADPLAQAVSVRVLGEPLPRVVEALAPPDVSLRVGKEFAETKCLVILRNVPLREAMDRLAQTFGGEWRQPKGAKTPDYILYRREDVKKWLEAWRKSRAEAERHAREFQKAGMRRAFDEAQTALKEAPNLSDASNDPPPANVGNIALARFLGTLSAPQLDRLFDGMAAQVPVRSGSEPEPGPPTLQLPFKSLTSAQQRLVREWVARTAVGAEREQRLAVLLASGVGVGLNQEGNGIQLSFLTPTPTLPVTSDVTYGGYGNTTVEAKFQAELFRLLSARPTPSGALLGSALTAEGTAKPAVFLPTPAPASLPVELPRAGGLNREFLPALADAHGWSLVADCHTRSNRSAPPGASPSPEETLKGAADRFQLVIRQEGGFLLARNQVWPDRDEEETPWPYPERWLEAKAAGESLSVADFLYLSELNPVRVACLRAYVDPANPQRTSFSRELKTARANRWVWDLVRELPSSLRRAAESKEGLSFAALAPKLREFTIRSSHWFRSVSESGEDMPPDQWDEVRFHLMTTPSPTRPNATIFQMAYLKDRKNPQPFWGLINYMPTPPGPGEQQ